MTKNQHIIQKIFLEIDTNSMEVANFLKNNANMFVKNELLQLIEKELSKFSLSENDMLQIEKIDLSLNTNTIKGFSGNTEFQSEIKKQIRKNINNALNQASSTSKTNLENESAQLLSEDDKKTSCLIHFLNYGEMPWYFNDAAFFNPGNLEKILRSELFLFQFQKIQNDANVQNRIVHQFSNAQIALLIKHSNPKTTIGLWKKDGLIELNRLNFEAKRTFWETVFKHLKNKNHEELHAFYMSFLANHKAFLQPESTQDPAGQTSALPKKAFFVANAGLIILHPFLKELFKKCELINTDNTLKNKELCAHILHYAATKKEHDYEHDMLFEKFLCGIPVQQPIKRAIDIDPVFKENTEEMLAAVVTHWSALKNSSTAVLRTGFLQRAGKLDLEDNNQKLFVAKKTQDILLDKIPWNISIVKIPWIEKLIYTEW